MNENELKDLSCNCDYYGAHNCLKHNPDHPTHVIERLKAERDALQAQSIDQALLVESLIPDFVQRILHGDEAHQQWLKDEGKAFMNPSPQPTIGVKALELVRKALAQSQAYDCLSDGRYFRPELLDTLTDEQKGRLIMSNIQMWRSAASFTKEELIQLGVG